MTDLGRGPDATSDDRLLARIWDWSAPAVEPKDAAAIARAASTEPGRRDRLVTAPRGRTMSLLNVPVIAVAVIAVLAVGALMTSTAPPTRPNLAGVPASPSPDVSFEPPRPTETPEPYYTLPPGRGVDWD